MSSLKTWLRKKDNRKQLSLDDLTVMINDVDNNHVAIKAGNIFPITYSQVATVTVSYFEIHKLSK